MGDKDTALLQSAIESAKAAHKRIDSMESHIKDLTVLTSAVASLQTETKEIKVDVVEIKTDLKQVTARPAQWWDKLIAAAIGACGSGLVATILAQILR